MGLDGIFNILMLKRGFDGGLWRSHWGCKRNLFAAFLGLAFALSLTACQIDVDFASNNINATPGAVSQTQVILAGASLHLEPAGGTPPYTYTPTASGFLDTTTGIYTVPTNADITSETVTVTDSTGKIFSMQIKVKGFAEHQIIAFPQGSDDQAYPTDAVWLPTGEILISVIGSDYMGERWAVMRSTDQGATWNRVDHFMGVEYEGESHPLSMASNGDTVFVCGYSYSYNADASVDPWSVWNVRRSLDRGTTWTSADAWWNTPGDNHVCYDVAVAPTTGYVYTAGYAGNNWIIRESRDNGATWTEIYNALPGGGTSGLAFQIAVAPNGTVFVLGNGGPSGHLYFLRGQETAGTWSWTPASSIPDVVAYGDYELRGTLRVVDDTTAYYAFRDATNGGGSVIKTSDGGDTWSSIYSGQTFLQGFTITSNGTLLASGGARDGWMGSPPADWVTVQSTDGGTSWTPTSLNTSLGLTGTQMPDGLPIVAHPSNGSVMAIGYENYGDRIRTALSTDNGSSWTEKGISTFLWSFYGSIQKLVRSSSNTLYSLCSYALPDGVWASWVIRRSTDNGLTWTSVDEVESASSGSPQASSFLIGHDGALYAGGAVDTNLIVRRSTDGLSWNTVFSAALAGTSLNKPVLLVARGSSETLGAFTDTVNENILIEGTSDGTTWTLKKTFSLPTGVDQVEATGFSVDSVGILWLATEELVNTGSLRTSVLYRSADFGVTWTEVKRGSTISGWNTTTLFKLDPQGHPVFWAKTGDLLTSADGGSTWTSLLTPTGFLSDFTWIDGQLFLAGDDPGGSGHEAVFVYDTATGTWETVEDATARQTQKKTIGEYDYDWSSDEFLEAGPNEIYVNEGFNDAYYGAKAVLRRLETAN